jgi:hypothetical protein
MIDPLSVATHGFFTTSSQNQAPITLATDGFILIGGQGKSKNKQKVWFDENEAYYEYSERLRNLVATRRGEEKVREITQDESVVEIEHKEPDTVIQAPPIRAYTQPLYEIKDQLERELTAELRRLAILEHADNERNIQIENREKMKKYRKKLGIMLMLLLEESDE